MPEESVLAALPSRLKEWGAGGPEGKGYISHATSRPPTTMPRKI